MALKTQNEGFAAISTFTAVPIQQAKQVLAASTLREQELTLVLGIWTNCLRLPEKMIKGTTHMERHIGIQPLNFWGQLS